VSSAPDTHCSHTLEQLYMRICNGRMRLSVANTQHHPTSFAIQNGLHNNHRPKSQRRFLCSCALMTAHTLLELLVSVYSADAHASYYEFPAMQREGPEFPHSNGAHTRTQRTLYWWTSLSEVIHTYIEVTQIHTLYTVLHMMITLAACGCSICGGGQARGCARCYLSWCPGRQRVRVAQSPPCWPAFHNMGTCVCVCVCVWCVLHSTTHNYTKSYKG
jgi:hypothetical protein